MPYPILDPTGTTEVAEAGDRVRVRVTATPQACADRLVPQGPAATR